MGTFLSLSGIVAKTDKDVAASLSKYAISTGGGLQSKEGMTTDDQNCCVILDRQGNTTVFYPDRYTQWDDSSQFLSRDLQTPVFSFHIHDGDLWMYILYVNGEVVEQFNPIPDYWEEIEKEEFEVWKGSAGTIGKFIPGINPADIENYLVQWDLDVDSKKAYPEDEFANEDWQMVDFMKKLALPYPIDDKGNIEGKTYQLWTDSLSLEKEKEYPSVGRVKKPWWKLW